MFCLQCISHSIPCGLVLRSRCCHKIVEKTLPRLKPPARREERFALVEPTYLHSRSEVRWLENKVARVSGKKCSVEKVSSLRLELQEWLSQDENPNDKICLQRAQHPQLTLPIRSVSPVEPIMPGSRLVTPHERHW
ncbi:hypothetical protein EDD15DRAFT_2318106 [Pisolithus albus]|nr:hypothetical protein EDD15DRAFT_2318106 [Pisolithus albus]